MKLLSVLLKCPLSINASLCSRMTTTHDDLERGEQMAGVGNALVGWPRDWLVDSVTCYQDWLKRKLERILVVRLLYWERANRATL